MPKTREATNEYRMRQWAQIIEERNQSGLTIADYCKAEGLTVHGYYYWLRKLRAEALSAMKSSEELGTALIPTEAIYASSKAIPSGWTVCEAAPEAPIRVNNPGAIQIEIGKSRLTVHPEMNLELLSQVCKVLCAIC